MVVPRRRLRKTKIIRCEEATIYRRPNSSPNRRIVRITHQPMELKMEHPKVQFYSNLIAKLVFPRNVVHFSALRVPKKWKPKKKGAITEYPKGVETYSREVSTTEFHKKYMKAVEKKWQKRSDQEQKIIDEYIGNKIDSTLVKRTLKEMRKAGLFVNEDPNNIDIINGNPLFFELSVINPKKLEEYIKAKKYSRSFRKTDQARALRLVKRLKTIWDSIE
ncbi:hypothetical protein KKG83_01195 [Candidatus Micrarchaeota archaeon]|nr:hypothetical protein [Candidatus Micrarchaeota archaeon]MBU2476064.1 hypothetical protein [Candidatus Micrarchaeota archaeon]